jgi:hypothetical protein
MAAKHLNHNVKAVVISEIVSHGIRDEIVDDILRYAKENGKHEKFYGNWDVEDVAIAYLWYLSCGPSYRKVYKKMKIPKSNLEQHFGTMRKILLSWANGKMKPGTAEERRAMAQKYISDEKFSNISGYFDCSDFRVVPMDMTKEEKLKCPSRKFKWKTAYKYFFHMLPDESIAFVGPMSPGKPHDMTVLKRDAVLWRRLVNMQPHEEFLADAGFVGWQNIEALQDVTIHTPHKKPSGGQLTPEQMDFNHRLSSLRSKIERSFGYLKNSFSILSLPFYGPPHRHEEIVKICVAIYNENVNLATRSSNLSINNLIA